MTCSSSNAALRQYASHDDAGNRIDRCFRDGLVDCKKFLGDRIGIYQGIEYGLTLKPVM
jgi:hypothetical protein